MREIEIHDYARQLLEAHGAKAIAEAAQNAIELEAKDEVELAKDWRHIEDAMKLMRGPHQSSSCRIACDRGEPECERRHAGSRLVRRQRRGGTILNERANTCVMAYLPCH